jgi:hypothetical protein
MQVQTEADVRHQHNQACQTLALHESTPEVTVSTMADCATMTDPMQSPTSTPVDGSKPQLPQSDRTQHLLGEIVRLQTQLAAAKAVGAARESAPIQELPPAFQEPAPTSDELATMATSLAKEERSHHGTQRKLQALSLTTKSTSRKLEFLQRAFAKAQQERKALQEENQILLTQVKAINQLERSPVAAPSVSRAVEVAHAQIQDLEQQLLLTRNQLMAYQQTADLAQARSLELEEQLQQATHALTVVVEDEAVPLVPSPVRSPQFKSPQEARVGRTQALLRLKVREIKTLEAAARQVTAWKTYALVYSGRQAAATRAYRNQARRLQCELERLRIELERHGDLQQQVRLVRSHMPVCMPVCMSVCSWLCLAVRNTDATSRALIGARRR